MSSAARAGPGPGLSGQPTHLTPALFPKRDPLLNACPCLAQPMCCQDRPSRPGSLFHTHSNPPGPGLRWKVGTLSTTTVLPCLPRPTTSLSTERALCPGGRWALALAPEPPDHFCSPRSFHFISFILSVSPARLVCSETLRAFFNTNNHDLILSSRQVRSTPALRDNQIAFNPTPLF